MAGKKKQKMVERSVILRNMVCSCCIHLLKNELDLDGIEIRPRNNTDRAGWDLSFPSVFQHHCKILYKIPIIL